MTSIILSSEKPLTLSDKVTNKASNFPRLKLFSTFSKILHQRPETRFPQYYSAALLAQDFIAFFGNKIRRIREDLDRSTPDNVFEFRDVASGCQFTTFESVSSTELMAIQRIYVFKVL